VVNLMLKILDSIDFFIAQWHRNNGDFSRARTSTAKILARGANTFDFIIAYDAFLLVREGRIEEAKERFEECLARDRLADTEEAQYVDLYCRFFLSVFNQTGQAVAIMQRAKSLHVDSVVSAALSYPTESDLQSILK